MKPHGVGPFPDYVDPVTINPPPAKEPLPVVPEKVNPVTSEAV